MNIEDAAQSLRQRLIGYPWLTAVGIGQHGGKPAIFVYVSKVRKDDLQFLDAGWQGYPVVIKQMGLPKPILTAFF